MNNRETPQVNAGSMADIAFLLLIFFLVTTTMDTESGIYKKLNQDTNTISDVNERNVLEIAINSKNEIQIENSQIIDVASIKQLVIDFIDNGARTDLNGSLCDWCQGKKDLSSSDHPAKAIVTLQTNRGTKYSTYIEVQNEINRAYTELRNRLAVSLYGKSFEKMLVSLNSNKRNQKLKVQIAEIKEKYPIHISEIAPLE
tara:strand:+ start:99929 stop:100528 length:600 start_codon:yes stop_codon:yes gene_type:complete